MQFAALSNEVYQILIATMVLTGPFLIVAIFLGLVLGLVQAVTHIQDQTVPQLVKIIVLSLMALGFGMWLSIPLYEQTVHVFSAFPYIVR
ncbi:MAG: flagellar biosynthetic protein FliQ [Pseudomonadota bacterium]